MPAALALGIIRLGAKPDGLVTVTAKGAVSNGLVAGGGGRVPFNDTASGHSLSADDLDSQCCGGLRLGHRPTVGAARGDRLLDRAGPAKALRQAIDELTNGILGWAGFRRDRTFEMGLVALPTTSFAGDYTEKDFFSLRQLPLPSGMSPPPYRIRAAYQVNWTQQQDVDATVFAGVADGRERPVLDRGFLKFGSECSHPGGSSAGAGYRRVAVVL